MKKLIILNGIFAFYILCSGNSCFAGVTGSKHDMLTQGKGADTNVCGYCHVAHNAAGEKIWSKWGNTARLTSGPSSTIGNMCYTCHDGTVTSLGQSTVFSMKLAQQHPVPSGSDCDMCHTVHDNKYGNFMKVARAQNSYCVSCHNATVNAGGLGDHSGEGNHQSFWTTQPVHGRRFTVRGNQYLCGFCHSKNPNSCNLCHQTAHNGNQNLMADKWGKWGGSFNGCRYCHQNYVSAYTAGNQHPTDVANSVCETCHDPHQPGEKPVFLLRNKNVDSGYCLECHQKSGGSRGPAIGNSHPVNIPLSLTPASSANTPTGSIIDDDGKKGVDYPANSNNIICETCHSVHRKGVEKPLLRMSFQNDALCLNCHLTKK